MAFVMELVGLIPGKTAFLRDFDPEARDGRGDVGVTTDIGEAMSFATMREALDLWKTQSETVPLRPDGEPNRPLTAFTAEILPHSGTRNDRL